MKHFQFTRQGRGVVVAFPGVLFIALLKSAIDSKPVVALEWAEPTVTIRQIADTYHGYSQWAVTDRKTGQKLGFVTGDTPMDAFFNVHNGNMYEREN